LKPLLQGDVFLFSRSFKAMFGLFLDSFSGFTPLKSNMTTEKYNHLKLYLLVNMVIFRCCVRFSGVVFHFSYCFPGKLQSTSFHLF